MSHIKSTGNLCVGNVVKKELSSAAYGNAAWSNNNGTNKEFSVNSELKRLMTNNPNFGYIFPGPKTFIQKNMWTTLFLSALNKT